jgi:hypothetical protein
MDGSNQQLEREVFQSLQKKYEGTSAQIAMHTLRLEQLISNNTTAYKFSILEDQSSKTKSEIRLNKNDILFMTSIGYGVIAVNNAAATSGTAAGKDSASEIATYPNQTIFLAATGFVPTDLEVFWKATLQLVVGTTTYIPGMETDGFRFVPQTQKSASTNYDQYSRNSGFMALPTYYELRGTDQINFEVDITSYTGLSVANANSNYENRLVLRPRGFIIRNGASIRLKKQIAED